MPKVHRIASIKREKRSKGERKRKTRPGPRSERHPLLPTGVVGPYPRWGQAEEDFEHSCIDYFWSAPVALKLPWIIRATGFQNLASSYLAALARCQEFLQASFA
jgi:hypothetical protein